MNIGFDEPLYIQPFDHRGSFQTARLKRLSAYLHSGSHRLFMFELQALVDIFEKART
jgi:hypothetical protein